MIIWALLLMQTTVDPAIEMALATPPEIAADALIRIAPTRLDVLERAFALAPAAAHPYRRYGAVGAAAGTDTDAGRLAAALDPGLDGLSLQTRAALAILKLDRAKGLEAFHRIPVPRFPALSCRDAMAYSPGPYYSLVREVFVHGFTDEQKKEGRHVAMLEDQVRALTSTFQLEPLTALLVDLPMTRAQFERLAAVYASALKMLTVDDRTFTSGTRHGFTQGFWDLLARARKLELPVLPLVDAYKTYLQSGLSGKRCKDSADPQGEGAWVANMVQLVNPLLKELDQAPIVTKDLRPQVVDEEAEAYAYWSAPKAKALFQSQVALLRAESREENWEHRVREHVTDLVTWEKDQADAPVNYFHQKAMLFEGLLRALPAGSLRRQTAASYLEFLLNSPVERQSPPEWYLYVRRLPALLPEPELKRQAHPGLLLYLDLARRHKEIPSR